MTAPIVIIGAARSGTKIVRDVLSEATRIGTVPYDVGFVWRYGNGSVPHDVLDPDTATPRVRRFIRGYLDRRSTEVVTRRGATESLLIEKTVGNTLRVPFVQAVLPEARYIHLVRDGVDAVESACRQWSTPASRSYLLQKARQFPVRLAPSYGRTYLRDQISLRIGQRGGVPRYASSWGPRYPGIDADVAAEELLTVCARQWRASVERAGSDLAQLPAPVVEVRYEDLVAAPQETLAAMITSLGLRAERQDLDRAAGRLVRDRTGLGASTLTPQQLAELEREIGPTLAALGYRSALSRSDGQDERKTVDVGHTERPEPGLGGDLAGRGVQEAPQP